MDLHQNRQSPRRCCCGTLGEVFAPVARIISHANVRVQRPHKGERFVPQTQVSNDVEAVVKLQKHLAEPAGRT